MESTGQTAIGTFIVAGSAVMVAVSLVAGDGFIGILPFLGDALAGVLFILAGIGRTIDAAGRTIARPQLDGAACVVIGVSFAPFAVHALDGGVASRAWGVAAGAGAATMVWVGVSFLTGRIEPAA
ncbi:hypothetical protein OB920_02040 [Halobacteria archaeon HArc-gm2]|nr:hypothetical protein [Halobacteria archaeon HArc-gm2]